MKEGKMCFSIWSSRASFMRTVVLLLVALVFAACGPTTRVALLPNTLTKPADVVVTGSGFPADKAVVVILTQVHGQVDLVLGRAKTDKEGTFKLTVSQTLLTPLLTGSGGASWKPLAPGVHTVVVKDLTGEVLGSAQLTIAK
jgi:hypothetical protein